MMHIVRGIVTVFVVLLRFNREREAKQKNKNGRKCDVGR
jgi:hypothetical protein